MFQGPSCFFATNQSTGETRAATNPNWAGVCEIIKDGFSWAYAKIAKKLNQARPDANCPTGEEAT